MNFIFPCLGNVIIRFDFHIFQRGRSTTNHIYIYNKRWLIVPQFIVGVQHIGSNPRMMKTDFFNAARNSSRSLVDGTDRAMATMAREVGQEEGAGVKE